MTRDTLMPELAPCPFCTSTTIIQTHYGTASCVDCGSEAALPIWNRRSSPAIAPEDAEMKPVAWRCKDYADGWIYYSSERLARKYQDDADCLMEALYLRAFIPVKAGE